MAPPDITRLIVRTSMRDRGAFDLLYRQTSAKLFGVCLRVLNDRGEAEEALQEVFVKIWTKADRFVASRSEPDLLAGGDSAQPCDRPPAGAAPAGGRTGRRDRRRRPCARDRRRGLWRAAKARASTTASTSWRRIGRRPSGAPISKAMSYAELAARHRVPLNTMRTWLRRSLLKLRECLER